MGVAGADFGWRGHGCGMVDVGFGESCCVCGCGLCVRGMYGCGMLVMASCVLVCGGIACGVSLETNDIGAEGCIALASGLHHVPSLTALQYVECMGWCAECWVVRGAMVGCGWG